MQVARQMGHATVPVMEDNWIPYCIPCIVQQLAGDAIGQVAEIHKLGISLTQKSQARADLQHPWVWDAKRLAGLANFNPIHQFY